MIGGNVYGFSYVILIPSKLVRKSLKWAIGNKFWGGIGNFGGRGIRMGLWGEWKNLPYFKVQFPNPQVENNESSLKKLNNIFKCIPAYMIIYFLFRRCTGIPHRDCSY